MLQICTSCFHGLRNIKSLDLSSFNTSNVTTMNHMFQNCSALKSINLSSFDISNVTSMSYTFNGCSDLERLDLSNFDTRNLTNVDSMFYNCSSLVSLNLSGCDFSKVNSLMNTFYPCSKLKNFTGLKNLGKGYTRKSTNYPGYTLDLSRCYNLTHDSLMSVINNLYDLNLTYDVANGGVLYTQSLHLGRTNLAKLTAEEIAIATSKGWNIT